MKSSLVFAAALTLCAAPLSAQSIDGKAYIISLLSPSPSAAIGTYFDATAELMAQHQGSYVVDPIYVEKELPNDYLPDVYSAFPSEYVTIARFDTPEGLNAYLTSAKDHFADWDARLDTEIRFSAGVIPAPNTDQALPVIGDLAPRGGESFVLLNASSFKPLPEVPQYINQYGTEIGTVINAGTQFFASFGKLNDITESYDFQILFLTEWASEEAFASVHENQSWRMVVPFRNFALSGFSEAKGVIGGMQ